MDELVGHPPGDVVIVVMGHADEHAQTGPDAGDLVVIDDDGRLRHPLDDGPHASNHGCAQTFALA